MFSKILIISAVLTTVTASTATATDYYISVRPANQHQDGYQKLDISEAVMGGASQPVWSNFALNPDCSATGGAMLRVVHPPEHGTVEISSEPFYPNYPQHDVRYACNSQKSPGNRAIYTAAAGYLGRDRVVLEGTLGKGVVRRIAIDIDVK